MTKLTIFPLFRWSATAKKMVEIPSQIHYELDVNIEYYVMIEDKNGFFRLPKNRELNSRDIGRYEEIHKRFTGYGFVKVIREI